MTVAARRPRIVFVTRKTPLEVLLERHGTLGQARFYLESRGQAIQWSEEAHERFHAGFARVQQALPPDERRTQVDRDSLDRFLFAPEDVVVVVGQDGLVANVAKYLAGQLAIGINPDPERYDGVLCAHLPQAMARLLHWLDEPGSGFRVQRRVMAVAEREDGQRLLALNEVFVGHRTHQSARYRIRVNGEEERQSSSGVICSTGTGGTGWARSIAEQRGLEDELPLPEAPFLAWFVREPFPSVSTGTLLDFGTVRPGDPLVIASEMGEDGVIFADGIEQDRLEFMQGQVVRIGVAEQALNLVVPVVAAPRRTHGTGAA